eukprot:TRINITY_DN1506_c0_g1_i3.p2 TRINITY_DN1506_c0_g1~~TRINITY_DN1506_c0_g1_i3.p2  ORF type:complete len:453 (+),score=210.58 TRINITY_DN1506_c0_g1_i3:54-1361(+)
MRGLVLLCLLAVAAAQVTRYGIVIDAGSSGSRINIYKWPLRTSASIPEPEDIGVDQAGFSRKISPGISAQEPANVASYLAPLFKYAELMIKPADRPHTPVFFMCTAGMRVLYEDNLAKGLEVMNAVRAYLKTTGYVFQDRWAVVLPGQSEGAFAWLTTNYLLQNLYPGATTVAALDMGGASMQINFVPQELPIDHYFPLRIANATYDLYTYSYLRYGKDQGMKRFNKIIAEEQPWGTDSDDNIVNACYWDGYQADDKDAGVSFVGSSDWDACYQYVTEKLMFQDTFCMTAPCAINGVYQPAIPANMPIYGLSSFFYTADFFQCKTAPNSNAGCIIKKAQDWCGPSRKWSDIEKAFSHISKKFLFRYCFDAAYVTSVLVEGFKFAPEREIVFAENIKGADAGWAMGALLYEVGLLPVAKNGMGTDGFLEVDAQDDA